MFLENSTFISPIGEFWNFLWQGILLYDCWLQESDQQKAYLAIVKW